MTITRSTDWNIKELEDAEQDGHIEVLDVSRHDARNLYTEIPEADWVAELADQIDEAAGDCTDGKPRYVVLKIVPDLRG